LSADRLEVTGAVEVKRRGAERLSEGVSGGHCRGKLLIAELVAKEANVSDVLVHESRTDPIDGIDECPEEVGPNRRSDVVRPS
jgi:hypothetical protein